MFTYFKGTKQAVDSPAVRRNDDGTFTLYTIPSGGTYAGQALRAFSFSLADLQWLAAQVKTAPVENLRPTKKAVPAAPVAPVAPAKGSDPLEDLRSEMETIKSLLVSVAKAAKGKATGGK